jgi:hypothetical protein
MESTSYDVNAIFTLFRPCGGLQWNQKTNGSVIFCWAIKMHLFLIAHISEIGYYEKKTTSAERNRL